MEPDRLPAWAILAVALMAAVIGGLTVRQLRLARLDELHGARLGMTPADVRSHFDEGPRGHWREAPGCGGIGLEWAPDAHTKGAVQWARFEFHEGMLMAVRMRAAAADPSVGGEPLEASSAVVVARQSMPGAAVAVALLARGCPEHQAEIDQLLGGGPMRR